jgi:hypothetical protein
MDDPHFSYITKLKKQNPVRFYRKGKTILLMSPQASKP